MSLGIRITVLTSQCYITSLGSLDSQTLSVRVTALGPAYVRPCLHRFDSLQDVLQITSTLSSSSLASYRCLPFFFNSQPFTLSHHLFFYQPSSLNGSGAAFSAGNRQLPMLPPQPGLLTTQLSLPHINHCPTFLDPGTQEKKSDSSTVISCGQGKQDSTKHHL